MEQLRLFSKYLNFFNKFTFGNIFHPGAPRAVGASLESNPPPGPKHPF
jgi:hypothetical protein